MASSKANVSELNLRNLSINRPVLSREDAKLRLYLLQHASAFAMVDELRERGWNSPEGDKVYEQKQKRADETIKSKSQEKVYYEVYQRIARELQTETRAFTIRPAFDPSTSQGSSGLRGLNLCMAPGGYTKALLEHNPRMLISGITLPVEKGGHPVMDSVADDSRVEVRYLDMNLLATAMGVPTSEIPADHPDADLFLTKTPFADHEYDAVIADGAVLRVHERGEHRVDKELESLRLRLAQLVFGLERIKKGGTLIFLSHRIDAWDNFALLRNFEHFSTVVVHKPKYNHTQSSSYYLVAKDVQPGHPMVPALLAKWKAKWREATFGGQDGQGTTPEGPSLELLKAAVVEYGPRFIELGSPVWKTQAEALGRAWYIRPPRTAGFSTSSTSAKQQPWGRPNQAGSWFSSSRSAMRDENVKPPSATKNVPDTGNSDSITGSDSKEEKPSAFNVPSWR